MHNCKTVIHRFLELITGDLVDQLEVAYDKAPEGEKVEAHAHFIIEKAKHRIAAATTACVVAIGSLIVDQLLPRT